MTDEPPELTMIDGGKVDGSFEREQCLYELDRHTRDLAANILRVIRGAGRPWEFVDQIIALHGDLRTAPPGVTVSDVCDAMTEALRGCFDETRQTFGDSVQAIEKGALRRVAASLLHQQLQAAAGDRDLWDGFYALEAAREESGRRHRAEIAEERKRASGKPRKRKPLYRNAEVKPPSEPVEKLEGESTADFMRRAALKP